MMADLDKPPRTITEAEWAELRRADMARGAVAAADALPDVLLGYQKRLMRATATHQVVLDEKSRRIGATWGVAADAVLTSAAQRGAGGMDTFYIGYNLDMAREFIDECAARARTFDQAATAVEEFLFDDADKSINAFRIRFASGFEIVALASRPRSLRGRQGYVIIDEAAFHDDLAGVLKAAIALLIWGGKVLVISTHLGEDNAFNRLIQDARAGRVPYHVERCTFDDALRDGLYQRICLVTGKTWSPEGEAAWRAGIIASYGEGADEELFCIPSKGGGVYLPRVLIEARMVPDLPVFRLEKPADFASLSKDQREAEVAEWCEVTLEAALKALDKRRRHAFGEDFGRVSDLTVIVPMEIGATLTRTVPFVVELRNVPFEQQRQVLFYIVDRLPRLVAGKMDATGNGAYLAEVAAQRYGMLRIEQLKLNSTWYLENFPPLKAAFEDGTIVLPANDDHVSDLSQVKTIAGIPQIPPVRVKAGDGKRRHADYAVGLVLAYAATRATPSEIAYRSASTDADSGLGLGGTEEDGERTWWRPPRGTGLRGST
jgi:phage FluMu gp28-like protein